MGPSQPKTRGVGGFRVIKRGGPLGCVAAFGWVCLCPACCSALAWTASLFACARIALLCYCSGVLQSRQRWLAILLDCASCSCGTTCLRRSCQTSLHGKYVLGVEQAEMAATHPVAQNWHELQMIANRTSWARDFAKWVTGAVHVEAAIFGSSRPVREIGLARSCFHAMLRRFLEDVDANVKPPMADTLRHCCVSASKH